MESNNRRNTPVTADLNTSEQVGVMSSFDIDESRVIGEICNLGDHAFVLQQGMTGSFPITHTKVFGRKQE